MNCLYTLTIAIFISVNASAEQNHKGYKKTKKYFQKELKKDDVHNACLSVYSPGKKISWSFYGGDYKDGSQVSSENPFYLASIGKTFTATVILQLTEEGKLKLDDTIGQYLSCEVMEGLHMLNDTDYSNEITVRHLLQHTSGLPDYFEGKTKDGSPNMMEMLLVEPEKLWEPNELIVFSKHKMAPNFKPGTDYRYTDTEYILLGLIIEKLSGRALCDVFEERFFKPLQMHHTYMNLRSKPLKPTSKIAEMYVGRIEVSALKSLSADWAGGGLVSTTEDINKFQTALFTEKLISNVSLEFMQNWIPESKSMYYGLGLRKFELREMFPMLPKLTLIGHSGSTASFMYYCPQLDVYLSGTLNQTNQVKESVLLMVKILLQLK
ncbi:serine hydrolase domain-containing protein [Saccharicrinis sp. GN24d3]|uniref:serine hydrolase domain-containing protein n=1 Tax=Saccharicrinis sp. GN24d3 TaxID=3458416 RepID=UPI004036BC1E